MFFIISLSMSFVFHNNNIQMSLKMIHYLKNNGNMYSNNLNYNDISWEKTNNCKNIINKYFYNMNEKQYKNNDNNFYGEMFKINGYPATLVIINKNLNSVEEFIINKNLLLMFDASKLLRSSFYDNFKKLNINNALNKNIFLII